METCDMIHAVDDVPGTADGFLLVRPCRKPAVARTEEKVSIVTRDGYVRYCESCLKAVTAWGVKTVPWPPTEE